MLEKNKGWEHIAKMMIDQNDVFRFEELFNNWQKEAILLTEITYAKTYTYVTPLGVFTHIGTLARALRHLFQKDWEITASLVGNELAFPVEKGIADMRHSFVCKFVELDQAYSHIHTEGWKFNNSFEFAIPRAALVPMATCLLQMAGDTELERCSQQAFDKWYVHVEEKSKNKIVLSMPTGESLFGMPATDGNE